MNNKKCLTCRSVKVEEHAEAGLMLVCTNGLSWSCGEYVCENHSCYKYSYGENYRIKKYLKENAN